MFLTRKKGAKWLSVVTLTVQLTFLLFLLITADAKTFGTLLGTFKRAARVAFNSITLSTLLSASIYTPIAQAESKLETLYHIKKPLPFKESKGFYQDLVTKNDKDALFNLNRYLIDYTFGTITTVRITTQ